ncbi:MAG: hypothetical protein ACPGU4_04090 [Flavobacteriales bacterium]
MRIFKLALLGLLLSVLSSNNGLAQTNNSPTTKDDLKKDSRPLTNEAILALSYQNGGLGFGVIYKKEVKENRFFRLGLANIGFNQYSESFSSSANYKYRNTDFVGNLVVGFEFRFRLHPKVFTYTGIDGMIGVSYASRVTDFHAQFIDDQTASSTVLQIGVVLNSGVQVKVHNLIMVGINVSPNIYFARRFVNDSSEDETIVDNAVQTSFDSSVVQATVVFTWPRKASKK